MSCVIIYCVQFANGAAFVCERPSTCCYEVCFLFSTGTSFGLCNISAIYRLWLYSTINV